MPTVTALRTRFPSFFNHQFSVGIQNYVNMIAHPIGYGVFFFLHTTVYYRFEVSALDESPQIYKVVLEFNRTNSFNINNWSLNGEENKYLSFEKVSSVPDNLTK